MRSIAATLSLASLLMISSVASATEFCDGFSAGYITGFRQARNTSLEPLVPLCSLQPLKRFGDPESDFEHGYTIGFKKGTSDGSAGR
jgi:hypothetical protein